MLSIKRRAILAIALGMALLTGTAFAQKTATASFGVSFVVLPAPVNCQSDVLSVQSKNNNVSNVSVTCSSDNNLINPIIYNGVDGHQVKNLSFVNVNHDINVSGLSSNGMPVTTVYF